MIFWQALWQLADGVELPPATVPAQNAASRAMIFIGPPPGCRCTIANPVHRTMCLPDRHQTRSVTLRGLCCDGRGFFPSCTTCRMQGSRTSCGYFDGSSDSAALRGDEIQ